MHLVRSGGVVEESGGVIVETAPERGLLDWLLEGWLGLVERGAKRQLQKQMRVVETLAIGGKKQLLLVSCGGERFLVGAGAESVQTIVPVRAEASGMNAGAVTKNFGDGS